ncbi:hypothetical protein ACQUQU_12670 [Thalassolituus sp. LLYu03]|uniref:hypothetical protein n=1 Tax=Thalassolituus sp. LLYu03 TaxID=3421656 RepID=UPI003D2D2922
MDALLTAFKALWLLIWLIAASSVEAAGQVVFVTHTSAPSVEQLAEKTRTLSGFDIQVINAAQAPAADAQACVVIGPQVLEGWSGCAGKPVIAVFVTRQQVAAHDGLASAVYLEPPLSRQIQLARAILGDDRPLGVLVGDRALWKPAKPDPLVTPYFTDQFPSLTHALIALLRNSHALIGIYDTELYSSENIKNILITAYRQNKPLIGPSSAYIKAGALATTFSDLDDVARRLSEVLKTGLREGVWPEAGYNPYFSVRYNPQVGRSLNLLLPDAAELADKLAKEEQRP